MDEQPNLKEHLTNLLNALTNLSPSRNLISQLTLLLPKDLTSIEYSYPEFNESEARGILSLLGIKFNGQVVRDDDSFAEALYKHEHKLFDWFDEETVQVEVAKVLDRSLDSIPNPYKEWAERVLAKFTEMPNGEKILRFLEMFIERESFKVDRRGYSRGAYPPDWQPFLDEVKKELQLNPAELEEILRLTVKVSGQSEPITREHRSYISGGGSRTVTWLEHSEYHLDLVISREWQEIDWHGRYDYDYLVRHRKTIRELLERLKYEPRETCAKKSS